MLHIEETAKSSWALFDLESSLRQTAFLFNGTITESSDIKTREADEPVYRSKIEEAAARGQDGRV